jgi:hypothetical protein
MRLNEVWSWDFVHDRTDNGVPLKILRAGHQGFLLISSLVESFTLEGYPTSLGLKGR